MEKKKVISTCVPFAECERILATAREKGKDAIAYKAMTRDGKQLSVTNIHGEGHGGEFSLVLTVEDPEETRREASPEETAADKPEEEAEGTDEEAGNVADKLVNALGLAIFAASILEKGPGQSYCQGQVEELRDWMHENGYISLFSDGIDKALKHATASLHALERKMDGEEE